MALDLEDYKAKISNMNPRKEGKEGEEVLAEYLNEDTVITIKPRQKELGI